MDNTPSPEIKESTTESPEPEVLQSRTEVGTVASEVAPPSQALASQETDKKPHHRTYRPSHRATFIGLGVVLLILAINAVILVVLLKKQAKNDLEKKGQVTISSADLSRLGINKSSIGPSGVDLIVAPNAQFKGTLSIAGNTTMGGQLVLNSKLTGTDANITQLQAGNTSLSQLNVNGDSTLNNLNLRKDLVVTGSTQLQGPVTLSQLLTVTNNINVTGNLAVGGVLSSNSFNARSVTATSTLSIGGHIISSGSAPAVGAGSAVGSNGTVSISGNDVAGAVGINIGAGASGGTLANIAFRGQYGSAPRVVISPVGIGGDFYVTNISVGGFSIGINSGLPPGGYRVNYIVVQ